MTQPLALGIDVGTSGVRAALLSETGAVCALAAARMDEIGADLRAPQVWEGTLALALSRLDPALKAEIGALSVDATSGTVVALDARHTPLGTALLYNDAVDDPAIPEAIAALAPRQSAAHGASSGLARALALSRRPGCALVLHQADWIASRLGAPVGVSDESNALKTGYDPVARAWPEWIAALPLSDVALPEVVPAGQPTGQVSADAAARHALPEGAVIVAGMTDGCASFLATGAAHPGEGVSALGTTLTLKLLSDKPLFAPEYGLYSHRIGDLWLAGGASNSGGAALAVHFAPEVIADLCRNIDPTTDSGLDYYPLPRPGERFPVNDPALPPRLEPRPAEEALFLKGLLEGIARIEALGYARLAELGAPALTRLRSVGGGAQNTVWTALRARLIQAEMVEAASTEAAVGVARAARAHLDGQPLGLRA